ncbi:hypothetical protein [Noviherbaspirillum sp. ST9]|uniref:hypothetical protein n=1 Tax=Noviherbaspirillum sp. ST9 TaxID=3401606 RepID=UPI003B589A70
MKQLVFLLAAALVAGAGAQAQTGVPKDPNPAVKVPPHVDKAPTDPGAVVTPPRTGTEEIVKTPNKAVDPKIDDATTDIDRRNRKKSEQKRTQ